MPLPRARRSDSSLLASLRPHVAPRQGVCHVALAQEGHCRPGEVLFGTDSHTCNAGAFGEFATGIGNTDAGFIMGTGKLLIKTPATMRFILDGKARRATSFSAPM